ncbi:hypothetical protein DD237_005792 [Peronospora effusa]|uniref:Uncharacterized protein n=1 Tax=Peronospora effusa TaxID=542832 RepID=A0A425C0S1_9STRA|nr:hypothetical protein DD237_005792 [Peronospora effusa]
MKTCQDTEDVQIRRDPSSSSAFISESNNSFVGVGTPCRFPPATMRPVIASISVLFNATPKFKIKM